MTVSPPRTASPTLTRQSTRHGQEHVHARAEFHDAEAIAGAHVGARLHAADDAAREDADDLPRDDRLPAVIDPDLAALVRRAGVVAIGRQKAARRVADVRDAPGRRDAVHVHVHRRQEDADLLPVAGRRAGATAPAGDEHAAVSRRQRPDGLPRGSRCDRDRGRRRRRRAASATKGIANDPASRRAPDTSADSKRAADERQVRRSRGAISRAPAAAGLAVRAAGCLPSDPSAAACVS